MKGPEPGAALRGFLAVVCDMVRIDPDRRPSAQMQRWHRDVAEQIGVLPPIARTGREMLDSALRLQQVLEGRGEAAPVPTPGRRALARQGV